jgi:hypothetical protein
MTIAHQIELERIHSKNQLVPRIRSEFQNCDSFDFSAHMLANGIPIPFGMDLLVQISLHKRADLPTMVGVLYHHFQDAQLTADMLAKCAEADLVDWNDGLGTRGLFVVKYTVSDDVQEELDRYQFPLPMVVEPKTLTCNRDTGYYLGGGSVILKNNHHESDVALDHLNRLNRIRFTINMDVVTMVKNQWRNLDKPKEGESQSEFKARQRAFEKYDRTAKDVMALLMQESDHFYLTHLFDKRGRTYAIGYHVNYMGNDWSKACVELYDKEIIE